jgi:beta-N-acetylhexosaminidase
MMAGIDGTAFGEELPRFGGYLLFPGAGAPLGAVRALTDALRAREGDLAPVIAIDQEGGTVARLTEGVEIMPPMMALGAADDRELTQRAGEQVAFDLRRAGCTLDFAPVLDLALDPQNTVIGTRAISADPRQVASIGAVFATGLQAGGILPCYKHFPGHGATAVDSHEMLPVIDVDEATLRARDLVPFAAVAAGAPAMMSAHVLVTAFDPQRPATLSQRIARDLLRVQLGFRGTFVTDSLEMNAIAAGDSVEGAVEALAAGADMLLFSHDADLASAATAAIVRAVEEGRVPLERLEEAHSRVLALRRAGAEPLPLDAFPPHLGVGREIARRATTLIRGLAHVDPVASIAVSFGSDDAMLEHESPALEALTAPIDPQPEQSDAILAALAQRKRRPLLLARRPDRHRAQADAVTRIIERYPDTVVVLFYEPFAVSLFPAARHLLVAYGDDASSIGGLADVLFGGTMPRLKVSS